MFEAAIAAQGPKLVKQVKGVIQYVITGGPGKKKWTWHTDLKNGSGSCVDGKAKKVSHHAVKQPIHRALGPGLHCALTKGGCG